MVGFDRNSDGMVDTRKNTTSIGARGEDAACEYLAALGHKIVARNFKTYFYEIDIVSVCGDKIYFTEVKTRKNHNFGGGMMAVDAKKLHQMEFAAECFMKYQARKFGTLNPCLAVTAVNGKYEVEEWVPIV